MIKTILSLLIGSALCASAQSYTHQRIGNFDFYNGSDGSCGSGQQIGQFYFYHGSDGSGTATRIGNMDFYNFIPDPNQD